MSKRKPSNIIRVGDEDFNFDPRAKFVMRKTKRLNIEWNNKYNASKIDVPSSVQRRFTDMYLYYQNVDIVCQYNVQRLEIPHMNKIFLEIKDSIIDSDISWYKQFTQAIGRQEFYVKGYLTWSQEHFLELPGQTYIQREKCNKSKVSPFKCCYFSIDAFHDYYLQGWTKMESKTVMDEPDLIQIRYGQMRIFPDDFIHGGGFNNTGSDDNFRMQLLIIDDGRKLYKP